MKCEIYKLIGAFGVLVVWTALLIAAMLWIGGCSKPTAPTEPVTDVRTAGKVSVNAVEVSRDTGYPGYDIANRWGFRLVERDGRVKVNAEGVFEYRNDYNGAGSNINIRFKFDTPPADDWSVKAFLDTPVNKDTVRGGSGHDTIDLTGFGATKPLGAQSATEQIIRTWGDWSLRDFKGGGKDTEIWNTHRIADGFTMRVVIDSPAKASVWQRGYSFRHKDPINGGPPDSAGTPIPDPSPPPYVEPIPPTFEGGPVNGPGSPGYTPPVEPDPEPEPTEPSISRTAGPSWRILTAVGSGDDPTKWEDLYMATGLMYEIEGPDDYTGTLVVSVSGGYPASKGVTHTGGSVTTVRYGYDGPWRLLPWRHPDDGPITSHPGVSASWRE